ncbi:hypothetical protein GpartN1_g5559.t1 [Galdieria partita]|uniref:Uncharacterized protein n=1 Tax=Galdieria partita TaxID=83374 RepID=A0A9C7PZH7_9RHOD|nr:hypothetical protein GpartN1_g5559.t1 [Galdieria partita]
MTLFSLRLLRHPVTKDFFAETMETSLPPFPRESMIGLEVSFEIERIREQERLLLLPLGIVSGLFIGSVVGETHSLMKGYGQDNFINPPSCRRFALDIEKQELLEVSWYLDKQIMLVNWVYFPTESHCLSYFVVYEAPVPGKLPHKLYKSVEMISHFEPDLKNDLDSNFWSRSLSLSKENSSLLACTVPEVKLFFQRIIAAKSGIVRTTEYMDDGNSVAVDHLARFSSHVRILRDSELVCFPSLQKTRFSATSQLPFIETDNASEGIRQLLYGQQEMNGNKQYLGMPRKVSNPLSYKGFTVSKKESTAMKENLVDCEFCKHAGNTSRHDAHVPSWIDTWNSMSSEDSSK